MRQKLLKYILFLIAVFVTDVIFLFLSMKDYKGGMFLRRGYFCIFTHKNRRFRGTTYSFV